MREREVLERELTPPDPFWRKWMGKLALGRLLVLGKMAPGMALAGLALGGSEEPQGVEVLSSGLRALIEELTSTQVR
jgi:hypothetical protein